MILKVQIRCALGECELGMTYLVKNDHLGGRFFICLSMIRSKRS